MRFRLLAGIPEAEAQRLLSVARRRRFARGEVVFHRDDPADCLHLVAKGRFAVRVITPARAVPHQAIPTTSAMARTVFMGAPSGFLRG